MLLLRVMDEDHLIEAGLKRDPLCILLFSIFLNHFVLHVSLANSIELRFAL